MRNTTGYYSGYICKKQPIGKFELKQAALNLRHLAHMISHRSPAQQYHHVANRMLGDLECRGPTSLISVPYEPYWLYWRALRALLPSRTRPTSLTR